MSMVYGTWFLSRELESTVITSFSQIFFKCGDMVYKPFYSPQNILLSIKDPS